MSIGTTGIVACSEEHRAFAPAGIQGLIARMGEQPFYISDILTDKALDERMLVAVAPITEGGAVSGYTLAKIRLDFYREVRERAELWSESTFYLLDGQRQIISAGTPDEAREDFVTTERERADY